MSIPNSSDLQVRPGKRRVRRTRTRWPDKKTLLTVLILSCLTLLVLCGRVPAEGVSGVFLTLLGISGAASEWRGGRRWEL